MTRLGIAVALALCVAPRAARADARAEAIILHDQGIKDMKAGQLDKACGELQASLELVRDSGTKGALATCHGLAGRIATAWLLWRELADTAPSADLRADAAAHATKLEPRLPRYLIAVPTAMSDLVVEINGRRVPSHVTVAVPIDPGKVRVRAVRQDGDGPVSEDWTRDYVAVERETIAIEIPALAPLRRAPTVKTSTAAKVVAPPPVDGTRHRRHVIAGVLGGVALVGIGVGAGFGVRAYQLHQDAKQACGGDLGACTDATLPAAQAKVADARSAAQISDVAFAAGGAIALAAVIVWATAPSAPTGERAVSLTPIVAPGEVGLVLGARF